MTPLQSNFWSRGFCVIDDFFEHPLVEGWRDLADHYVHKDPLPEGVKRIQKAFSEPDAETRDAAGTYDLFTLDGHASFTFPHLRELYHAQLPFLRLFTGLPVITSPDPKSAVTVMVYPAPAGQMVAHYDTQNLTFLLYLTDNDDGGTEVLPIDKRRPTVLGQPDEIIGEPEIVLPRTGRVVLMQGRRVWHRSLPVAGKSKVSSAWNYYVEGDTWRPAGVSSRLYS